MTTDREQFKRGAKPDVLDLLAELEEAEARIQAARDLHRSVGLTEHTGPRIKPSGTPIPDDTPVCEHCTNPDAMGWVDWPCPTIEALNGDA